METKICKQCNRLRDIAFFRKRGRYSCHELVARQRTSPKCKECEDTERLATKVANPWHDKVKDTVRRHAKVRKMNSKQFLKEFDLTYEYIEKLFENAWNNDWCQHCEKSFRQYGREFMELDIVNRDYLPFRFNLRVIHRWDNRSKGIKNPQDFDQECKEWRPGVNIQTVMDLGIDNDPIFQQN